MISEESQDSVYWSIDTENSAFSAISKILLFYCTFVQKKKCSLSEHKTFHIINITKLKTLHSLCSCMYISDKHIFSAIFFVEVLIF